MFDGVDVVKIARMRFLKQESVILGQSQVSVDKKA